MIGTQMACSPDVMDQERRFQAVLAAAQSLMPQANGNLRLGAADRRTVLLGLGDPANAPGQHLKFSTLRCGGKPIAVNLSPALAIVELDGERIELPNSSAGDPEAPRLFTNGRVTLFQTLEGHNRGFKIAIAPISPRSSGP